MKKFIILLFVIVMLFIAAPVLAQEAINNFNVTIKINVDSSIDVTEEIIYDFGNLQRHGLYRDIPVKYKARGGNYNLRISDISVTDNNGELYNFEGLCCTNNF